jgi:hypothetical protein
MKRLFPPGSSSWVNAEASCPTGTGTIVFCTGCVAVRMQLNPLMSATAPPPCWLHRGCRIQLIGYPRCEGAYLIQHSSGAVLGRTASLTAARLLIDEQISLLRQRLAAAA